MKFYNARQQKIIEKVEKLQYISVQELSEMLDVSLVTIRKDLSYLEDKGLLFRTHGGASKTNLYAFERNVTDKESIAVEEKKKIAQEAVKLIEDNDFLILASGSTIHYLAKKLSSFRSMTVLTPSLPVAFDLAMFPNVQVILLGGQLRKSSISTIGVISESVLANFSCNKLFLGVDGIDLDFGISTSNAAEAHLNRLMIKQAKETIVLLDSSKINKKGFGKICDISQIDVIITDNKIEKSFVSKIEKMGVRVVIAK